MKVLRCCLSPSWNLSRFLIFSLTKILTFIWVDSYFSRSGILKFWNLRFWDFEIWDFDISKSEIFEIWDFEILKSEILRFQNLRFWDFEIWDFEILKSEIFEIWDFEILKSEILSEIGGVAGLEALVVSLLGGGEGGGVGIKQVHEIKAFRKFWLR